MFPVSSESRQCKVLESECRSVRESEGKSVRESECRSIEKVLEKVSAE